MRLIRITTSDDTAFFDNSFNEDIKLEENSQIALLNITAELPPKELIIDGTNDIITYQLSNGEVRQIQLTHATYGGTTQSGKPFSTLLSDVSQKLNDTLTSETDIATTKSIACQFRVLSDGDNKTLIEWSQDSNDVVNQNSHDTLNWTFINVSSTPITGYIGRDGGTDGVMDSYMYNTDPMAMGGGVIRARLRSFVNATPPPGINEDKGVIVALSKNNPKDWATGTIDYTQLDYGVQIYKDSEDYGVVSPAGVDWAPAVGITPNITGTFGDNDFMEVGMSLGKIQVRVRQNNSDNILFEQSVSEDTKLYPIIIYLGNQNGGANGGVVLQSVRYFKNPFGKNTSGVYDPEELGANNPKLPSSAPTTAIINFESLAVSNYLGYTKVSYTNTNIGAGWVVSAENVSQHSGLHADNFIIELLNLELNCYDGYSSSTGNIRSGRKNILATIPQDVDIDDVLRFETSTPYFLNLRNRETISLRNIRARVLNFDYSSVILRGQATITLLIKDSKDR